MLQMSMREETGMDQREMALYHYVKLKALLDADEYHIAECLKGDLLDAYREIIDREKEVLGNIISRIYE